MPETLDARIARLSADPNKLKLRKMESLQQQLRQLEAGEEEQTPKRAYRRFTETEIQESLGKVVAESGEEGISAWAASMRSGIPYARTNAAMARLFRKAGMGRNPRYFVKKKRGG